MFEKNEPQPQQKKNILGILATERVQRDGEWGANVTVQGGTIFFKDGTFPEGDLSDFKLHETLTGEGPVKDASYSFVPKSEE